MTTISQNAIEVARKGGPCKLFGIKLITPPSVVYFAANAGFDALFIDLEHSTLSLESAAGLCVSALSLNLTPFIRVPYQCGDGFVQRVLDNGARGVVFPHIYDEGDAKAAVKICEYPPSGSRSMTGQLPPFDFKTTPQVKVMWEMNEHGSTVLLQIETVASVDNVEAIAAVPGVDVLLIGANDLSIEMGIAGDFENERFRDALRKVSKACQNNGKIMGLAGVYNRSEYQKWAVRELGVRLILGDQDAALVAAGSRRCVEALSRL